MTHKYIPIVHSVLKMVRNFRGKIGERLLLVKNFQSHSRFLGKFCYINKFSEVLAMKQGGYRNKKRKNKQIIAGLCACLRCKHRKNLAQHY